MLIAKAILWWVASVVGTQRYVELLNRWYRTVEENAQKRESWFKQVAIYIRSESLEDICRESKSAALAEMEQTQRLRGTLQLDIQRRIVNVVHIRRYMLVEATRGMTTREL